MRLPTKLSQLLCMAVEDARAIAKTPGYRLKMNVWHAPKGRTCDVCMAGAVMARHLRASPEERRTPPDYPKGSDSLRAINFMRAGWFLSAAAELGVNPPDKVLDAAKRAVMRSYSQRTGRARWADYLKAADILEKAGF